MMHTSGRSFASRLGLAFVLCSAFALGEVTEVCADVPTGDAFLATGVLVPGINGAELLGGDRGEGHTEFRIRFGADLRLSVNGVDAGQFDPSATYRVTVQCESVGCIWFATTHVVNQTTGIPVFCQMNYPMLCAAEQVRIVAEDAVQLTVQ